MKKSKTSKKPTGKITYKLNTGPMGRRFETEWITNKEYDVVDNLIIDNEGFARRLFVELPKHQAEWLADILNVADEKGHLDEAT